MSGRLGGTGIPITLVMGMENHAVPELGAMFRDGRALPIGKTRYALIEMPFFGHPEHLEPTLSEVLSLGITPVLAHPERIEAVQRRPQLLVRLVESGMLSQVTAGSLLGHFGAGVRRFTEDLVRGGLAHLIASDCHRPDGPRSPHLGPGLAAARRPGGQVRGREDGQRGPQGDRGGPGHRGRPSGMRAADGVAGGPAGPLRASSRSRSPSFRA